MLRSGKFRPFEKAILRGIAFLLFGAGIVGLFVAIERGHWQLALVSASILLLAILYAYALRRGRPI
jgi:uncharacterized membrane protein YqjE